MDRVEETVQKIKDLKIQGATSVARASLEVLKTVAPEKLETAVRKLAWARPTEPLTRNSLNYVVWQVKKGLEIKEAVDLMLSRLLDVENEITTKGRNLIKPGMKILTHCHSSTVEAILKAAYRQGINFSVYVTETEPMLQGRITAENLIKEGIKTTMITDSAAPYTLSQLDKIEINLVFLGADALALDGSCVNKIGSFAISLAAQEAKIPLYIATTLLKLDPQAKAAEKIKIEARNPSEIWAHPPRELRIINPAFDVVIEQRIKAYLTEFGLVKPKKIVNLIRKHYPWLIKKSKIKTKKLKREKQFSYLFLDEKFDSERHIIATYRLEAKADFLKAAGQVAAESSIGTWTKVTTQTEKSFRLLSAKVFEVEQATKRIKIAYPLALFEPGNIPQLLSSVAGNIFGMKTVRNLRLEDLVLPEKFVKSFPGPSFGLPGIRKYLKIRGRPILGSIIKPKQGLTTAEHVNITKKLFQAGLDLIKDDENLTSPTFNPFDQRLVLITKVIRAMKKPKIYAFNITAPYQLMVRRAQRALNVRTKCIMVDIVTVGFAALQSLRSKFPDLIIHGHRAMHGAITRNKKHGVSMLVLAKLARLAGVDQLHTGTIIGKMEGGKQEILMINQFLSSEWYGLKPVLPIASGGLYPALVPKLIKILGQDMVFTFGGGIHGHPNGTKAGAKAVVQAVEAVRQRKSLKKYGQTHPELKVALKTWPKAD